MSENHIIMTTSARIAPMAPCGHRAVCRLYSCRTSS